MVGPYRLLEQIGEGGFGTVWLAERREPIVQRVALKILNPGMDTREVLARFEQERQALAVMNHPNVAKVFDAGATEYVPGQTGGGRPYFAMEHVPGEPITDYCDRHRLTIKERLELFIPVCEAVQHAHHKGIIHRDIKPSNILVAVHEGRAVPKVIDFGVAKAVSHTLTQKTIFTEHGHLIGTPEYMSPEQAEMGATDVDTRTDVYALGVVLYELLSGLLPFDSKALRAAGFDAVRRIIREQEPPRPSTRLSTVGDDASAAFAKSRHTEREHLARELRRELDWIPLKAIRKDRGQRYDTAMALAEDIGRYLKGEALEAGPESAVYRLRKLVRRNKGSVIAVSAVLLALVLGLGGTLWQARRANDRAEAATKAESEQRRLAESESAARRLADTKAGEADAALKTIEYNSYVANLQMAAAAMEFRQFDRVRQRLNACPERLRGWEWGWLNATTDTSLVRYDGHRGPVTCVALSPDSKRLATASADATARIWDLAGGQMLFELLGHTNWVTTVAYSADGSRLITGSADGTVRIWDAMDGKELSVFKCQSVMVTSAAFNGDGTRFVTAAGDIISPSSTVIWGGGSPAVWDVATGARLVELKSEADDQRVQLASFSPDGSKIVTASMDRTRVWDAVTGASLAELKGHTREVRSAAFSPDGTRIVTASGDKTARAWDAAAGTSLVEFNGHTGSVNSAAFSHEGGLIATASTDNTARVWDSTTGEMQCELLGHTGKVTSVAFNSDSSRVATASFDNTARLWAVAARSNYTLFNGHSDVVTAANMSSDGKLLVTASGDHSARLWDVATGALLLTLAGHTSEVNDAQFSQDGTRVVTSSTDETTCVWDAATGSLRWKKTWRGALVRGGMVTSASFSPDGTRVVATNRSDSIAQILDAETGAPTATLEGHSSGIEFAQYSKDGRRLVTASRDGTARIWDAASNSSLMELRHGSELVFVAAISPDGTRVATATVNPHSASMGPSPGALQGEIDARLVTGERGVRVWDIATGQVIVELRGHTGRVTSVAFDPSGSRMVTSSQDHTARVWSAATGECLVELKGHTSWLSSAAFSSDGTRIVTASADHTARVWDSVPYRERFPAIERARVAKAKMTPIVQSRLNAGETIESLRAAFAAETTLTVDELTAVHVAMQAYIDKRADARVKAAALNRDAWEAVAFAPVAPAAALKALAGARQAVELAPGDGDILNTVAVALYRAGNFEESLATLLKAEDIYAKLPDTSRRGPQPSDWAFIAMAHYQLHHEPQARAALAKLRELAATDRWKADEETAAWLNEAEALIVPH